MTKQVFFFFKASKFHFNFYGQKWDDAHFLNDINMTTIHWSSGDDIHVKKAVAGSKISIFSFTFL